jgi:protein phosphatase
MDCYGRTDIGRRRETNQDQFLIADLVKSMQVHQTSLGLDHQTRLFGNSLGKLLVVADGMGGAAAGERASQLAVDSLATYVLNTLDWFFRLDAGREKDFVAELEDALRRCQRELEREVEKSPRKRGMGTTLTMAYVIWPRMYVVHVGDSRCYQVRGPRIQRLTTDHTIAQQCVEAGTLQPEEAEHSRWSNVLWNFIGRSDNEIMPEVHKVELHLGDAVVLCTDGLTKHVSEREIAGILAGGPSARETCDKLVEAALADGGTDNVTAIVARFLDSRQALELVAAAEQTDNVGDTALEPGLSPEEVAREPAYAEAVPLATLLGALPAGDHS